MSERKKFWLSHLVGTVISLGLGIGLGLWFENRSIDSEIKSAVDDAVLKATIDTTERAMQEFAQKNPIRTMELFPEVFQASRDDAYASGYAQCEKDFPKVDLVAIKQDAYSLGVKESCRQQYENGLADGRRGESDERDAIEYAQRRWDSYEVVINELALMAAKLEETNSEALAKEFLAKAIAANDLALMLRDGFSQQASAFNSLMSDLGEAVKARNYPNMRTLSIALSQTLKSKEEQFLEGYSKMVKAFGAMGVDY